MVISGVIPNYNGGEKLVKTVNLCLEYCDEVLVVDDYSQDNSISNLVKRVRNKKLKILKNEKNSGASYCRNKGFSESIGNKVLFIDNDCYLNKVNFKKMLEYKGDIVYPKIIDSNKKLYNYHKGQKYLQNSVCFIISREKFEKIGGFDENIIIYMDDVEFFYRCYKDKLTFRYIANAEGYHDGKKSMSNISRIFFLNLKNTVYFCLKHKRFGLLKDDFPNLLTVLLNLRRAIINKDRLYNKNITNYRIVTFLKSLGTIMSGIKLYITRKSTGEYF